MPVTKLMPDAKLMPVLPYRLKIKSLLVQFLPNFLILTPILLL